MFGETAKNPTSLLGNTAANQTEHVNVPPTPAHVAPFGSSNSTEMSVATSVQPAPASGVSFAVSNTPLFGVAEVQKTNENSSNPKPGVFSFSQSKSSAPALSFGASAIEKSSFGGFNPSVGEKANEISPNANTLFGSSAAPAISFGGPQTIGTFGISNTAVSAPTFGISNSDANSGAPTPSFGTNSNGSAVSFGHMAAESNTVSQFGSSSQNPIASFGNSSSTIGSTSTNAASTGFSFVGQNSNSSFGQPINNGFGQSNAAPAFGQNNSTSGFGQSVTSSTPNFSFGAPSTDQKNFPNFNFGNQPQSNFTFGVPNQTSIPSFGGSDTGDKGLNMASSIQAPTFNAIGGGVNVPSFNTQPRTNRPLATPKSRRVPKGRR
jgi:hypothetical protein